MEAPVAHQQSPFFRVVTFGVSGGNLCGGSDSAARTRCSFRHGVHSGHPRHILRVSVGILSDVENGGFGRVFGERCIGHRALFRAGKSDLADREEPVRGSSSGVGVVERVDQQRCC